MANFVRHEPCPRCRSRGMDSRGNNLGVYSDHSTYCFACGYSTKGSTYTKPFEVEMQTYKKIRELPEDVGRHIQPIAYDWLQKYGISHDEIRDNGFLWSEKKQWLIYPIKGEETTIINWQARCFGDGPKYMTGGPLRDVLDIKGNFIEDDSIILCEDILSAIKVSRQFNSMALFGSVIPPRLVYRLKDRFKRLVIWLDMDKQKEARRMASRASQVIPTDVIMTEKDPKEYNDYEIKEIVKNGRE